MIQRIKDWRHEPSIKRLSRKCAEAMKAGDKDAARAFWHAQADAIRSRSPGQVARMELKLGIGVRRSIKRRVMDWFLRGRIPAWIVTTTFRLFNLRSL